MSGVISMADKTNSSMHWSPEDVLVESLKRVREGDWKGRKKILVLSIEDDDGTFLISELQSGMRLSQELAVLEFAKYCILKEMKE